MSLYACVARSSDGLQLCASASRDYQLPTAIAKEIKSICKGSSSAMGRFVAGPYDASGTPLDNGDEGNAVVILSEVLTGFVYLVLFPNADYARLVGFAFLRELSEAFLAHPHLVSKAMVAARPYSLMELEEQMASLHQRYRQPNAVQSRTNMAVLAQELREVPPVERVAGASTPRFTALPFVEQARHLSLDDDPLSSSLSSTPRHSVVTGSTATTTTAAAATTHAFQQQHNTREPIFIAIDLLLALSSVILAVAVYTSASALTFPALDEVLFNHDPFAKVVRHTHGHREATTLLSGLFLYMIAHHAVQTLALVFHWHWTHLPSILMTAIASLCALMTHQHASTTVSPAQSFSFTAPSALFGIQQRLSPALFAAMALVALLSAFRRRPSHWRFALPLTQKEAPRKTLVD